MSQEKQFDKNGEGLALPLEAINVSGKDGWDFGWCVVNANKRVHGYCLTEKQAHQIVDAVNGTIPSHVAPKCGSCSAVLESSGRCPNQWYHDSRSSIPSTTPQKPGETPRTDALRKLMGEIYEPDNAALDHMLEKYTELERELAAERTMHVSNVGYLSGKCDETTASATPCSGDAQLEAVARTAARSARSMAIEDCAKLIDQKGQALTEEYCHGDAGPDGYTWTNKEAEWQVILLGELADEMRAADGGKQT